jgi:4-hydroxybenzoate polyprenyltransferase
MQLQIGKQRPVLCVDLTGTLLRTSLRLEAALSLLRADPATALLLPYWFAVGSDRIATEASRRIPFDPAALAYAPGIVAYLKQEKARGRTIELVSTADPLHTHAIADYLGLFDAVLIVDTPPANATERTWQQLSARHGHGNFDYLASPRDTGNEPSEIGRISGATGLRPSLTAYIEALRPHQWSKNLLVFVPLLLAHRIDEPLAWIQSLAALIAFCLSASAIYLMNDLIDAPADIRHPTKRNRPIASGRVDRRVMPILIPSLILAAVGIAAVASRELFVVILIYLALTTAYSLVIKRKMLWDVFTLAALYTLRIIGGAVAIDKSLSFWLLAFSVFTFLSLALVKRFVELAALAETTGEQQGRLASRGYRVCDIETLHQVGIASCFSGVMVFALYIDSTSVQGLYRTPELLWLVCPALLYLLLRFWMLARRNEMHDDPVVFALGDLRSQAVLAGIVAAMIGAKFW